MKSKVWIGIDKSKSYRIHLIITTDIVEESRKMHMTSPLATATLGRVLTAIGMMSVDLKDDKNSITLIFQGDGQTKQVLATAYGNGDLKGYVSNPLVDLPLNEKGKLDVGGGIGNGKLFVTKDLGMKEPYVGVIDLVTGEIAEDLTQYFYTSEQKNTSVSLGVKVGKNQNVVASGGMIIEVLPDATEDSLVELEKFIDQMRPITSYIEEVALSGKKGEEALELLKNMIFKDISTEYEPELLEIKEVQLKCDCSRQRIEEAFMTIGKDEILTIYNEDEKAEMQCHFCNKKYYFDKIDLENILNNM